MASRIALTLRPAPQSSRLLSVKRFHPLPPPRLPTRRFHRPPPPCAILGGAEALIPPTNQWGMWSSLAFCAWAGLYSEKFRLGKELSGALVSTLVALLLSNLGILSTSAPQYDTINRYLLPLAVPMLLFSADLRRVLRDTGRLLAAFTLGTIGTVIGTVIAFSIFPLASLGTDGWKIAAALCARHIGGAVNYVSVSEALQMSSAALTAGLAADNLICAIYFTSLYALARSIGPDTPSSSSSSSSSSTGGDDAERVAKEAAENEDGRGRVITVLPGSTALMFSALICFGSDFVARAIGAPSLVICFATALTVLIATLFPRRLAPYVSSAEGLAAILLQFFFAAIGASGSVAEVVTKAPALFTFSLLQIAIHLAILFALGKLFKFSQKDILLASNANVGGPTTAAGMCVAKGWKTAVVPSVLVGTFGYAIATFLSVALGHGLLRGMAGMA